MFRARRIAAALLLVVSITSAQSFAQPARRSNPTPGATGASSTFPWEGEVTGTNVRVRSGPGTDRYATTKVNTGDRVLVVGEQNGWYEITSLPRSFSYIDMSEVERMAGGRTAKVKQSRATVRAGSELNQSKSAAQTTLDPGTIVEVIGEGDGFLKIKSPASAHLYITKDYVRPVAVNLRTGMVERYNAARGFEKEAAPRQPIAQPQPGRSTSPNAVSPNALSQQPATGNSTNSTGEPTGSTLSGVQPMGSATTAVDENTPDDETGDMIGMEGADPSTEDEQNAPLETDPSIQALKGAATSNNNNTRAEVPAAPMQTSSGRYQALLTTVESDLNAMMLLPLPERDIDTLINRYQEIAVQTEERVPAEYANIRISQLKSMDELRKIRATANAEAGEMDAFRDRMSMERMKIMKAKAEKITEKFDFVGQLLKSHAFAPEKRRYRLVDPKRQTTIAYIDIPRDVTENVEFMIGRTVGIRVAGRRYSQAARIPIAVAASLTDLTPPADPAPAKTPSSTENVPVDSVMPPPLEEDDEPTTESAPAAGPQASNPGTGSNRVASGS